MIDSDPARGGFPPRFPFGAGFLLPFHPRIRANAQVFPFPFWRVWGP